MRIGIAGGGSLGLLCATHLMAQKHEVFLQLRNKEQINKVNSSGIRLEGDDNLYVPKAGRETTEQMDIWFCTVKQHHVNELFLKWKPHAPVLMLQNGIGHMHAVPDEVEAYPAVVTHGALRLSINEVRHTGLGNIAVPKSANKVLQKLISQSGRLQLVEDQDIQKRIYKKLVMNAVINPLTVLYEKPNGWLLLSSEAKEEARQLCLEAASIVGLEETIWEEVQELIERTAANRSSMLADFEAGRPLEIEAINGALIALAAPGRAARHQHIVHLVRKKEEER
ncbi:2-dehydropantoate 2-reductase [Alkalicoccus luteus]|uniref:2-dehydropantoate 2-reductase n=1 Tax=Alkalicoccus luteus TaxID=1237094 RepID=A0A969TTZ8_9BACI|nr:2-dehydropantoate 2-reductase [Alkalicoccus luteus]